MHASSSKWWCKHERDVFPSPVTMNWMGSLGSFSTWRSLDFIDILIKCLPNDDMQGMRFSTYGQAWCFPFFHWQDVRDVREYERRCQKQVKLEFWDKADMLPEIWHCCEEGRKEGRRKWPCAYQWGGKKSSECWSSMLHEKVSEGALVIIWKMQLVGLTELVKYIQHTWVPTRGKYLSLLWVYIQRLAHLLDHSQYCYFHGYKAKWPKISMHKR